jgi:ComF family protein
MLDRLVAILAPHTCVVCGSEGRLLCGWCAPDAVLPLPERCYRCYALSADSAVCQTCRRHSPLRCVWVRAQYAGAAKELVYRLKFGRVSAAANAIVTLLDEAIPYLPTETVVTYVPTATGRVRVRGYDQSSLIARAFAKHHGLQFITALARGGQSRQVGSDRKHRQAQAAQNYRSLRPEDVRGKQILLIDDITTTGATLESAAKILKKAGAKRIYAAVFAQKQ